MIVTTTFTARRNDLRVTHKYDACSTKATSQRNNQKKTKYRLSAQFLHLAANGDHDAVEKMLNAGIDPNIRDELGRSALSFAVTRGDVQMTKLLLSRSADPNIKDKNGNAPLHLIAVTSRMDIMKLLIDAGADMSAKDRKGNIPARWARTRLAMVRRLIEKSRKNSNGDEENNKQNLVRLSGEIQSIISFLTAVSSQPPRENNRSHCSLSMSSEDYSVALNKVTQQMEAMQHVDSADRICDMIEQLCLDTPSTVSHEGC